MEESLIKIKSQLSSKLQNQKQISVLLLAIESTLEEQGQPKPFTATCYYSTLISTLEQSIQSSKNDLVNKSSLPEGHLITSTLYLLSIIIPYMSSNVLHNQAQNLSDLLLPLLPLLTNSAPALRSLIVSLEYVYNSLDNQQLSSNSLNFKSSFNQLLQLTIDQKPKVRRKAQESITSILNSDHPYVNLTTKFVIESLESLTNKQKNNKKYLTPECGIWLCSFIQLLRSVWPISTLPQLATTLLNLPHLGNSYLSSSAYNLLSNLLSHQNSHTAFQPEKLTSLVNTIINSIPKVDDVPLLSPWLGIVDAAISTYVRQHPVETSQLILKIWPKIYNDYGLSNNHVDVRKSAEKALCGIIRYGINNDMIKSSIDNSSNINILPILDQIHSSLTSITHRQALPNVLTVLVAMISKLRIRFQIPGPTSAEILIESHLKTVGELRQIPNFEYREKTDDVFGMAIEVCGPDYVISTLPLNLEPSKQGKGKEGRAYLLPLLRSRITNTNLSYFINNLVPLSSTLFDLSKTANDQNKQLESKIYSTLTEQIWACFPSFCDLPIDLRQSLNDDFAGLLSNVLYTQQNLRSYVLRGLRNLVEKNLTLCKSAGPEDEISKTFNGLNQHEAKLNVEYLSQLAANLLSVLFNLFSTVPKESRGMVGEVISDYLLIASDKDISGTYKKMSKSLLETLPQHNIKMAKQAKSNKTFSNTNDNDQPPPHTTLDLIILLAPRLNNKNAASAWELGINEQVLMSEDQAVQKKAYKLLNKLCESQSSLFKNNDERVEKSIQILTDTDNVANGVKRDRLELLSLIVPYIPSNKLSYVIQIVPEAVLGVKESNEKARTAAFELLIELGKRMKSGGNIERGKLSNNDDDDNMNENDDQEDVEVVDANINEYFTILSAGLAGTTPHFISASITSLARILFEFKEELDKNLLSSLLSTLHLFVASTNKEIVKSAIGLVKVTTLSLSSEMVYEHLPTLIPSLLGWKSEHKNHFRNNVKHILERLVKRFGIDVISSHVPEEDQKLITSIRKNIQRSKKKKESRSNEEVRDILDENSDDDGNQQKRNKSQGQDAFEDALYGSESEIDESDNDEDTQMVDNSKRNKNKSKNQTYIREDEGELVDLLDKTVVGKISTTNPSKNTDKRKKPGQDAQKYKTDDETGKLIIEDEDKDDEKEDNKDEVAGAAYLDNLAGEDGITMGSDGRVRFNKKRDRDNDINMEEEDEVDIKKDNKMKSKKQKQGSVQVGSEFKSKRAGGDVHKKGGQQPYAYVPLNQSKKLSKSGQQGPRLDVTGKKKGRSGKK